MSIRQRQLIGGLLGALMLNATVAPSIAFAMAEDATRRTAALTVTETVDLFLPDGRREAHLAGVALSARVLARALVFREADRKQVEGLRAVFVRYGKASRRGTASVAMSLQVIDAITAPTDAQYHQGLQQLPIAVSRTVTHDEFGRSGIATEYRLKGVLKVRRFSVAEPAGPAATVQQHSNSSEENPADAISAEFTSTATPMTRVVRTNCEYTDPDNNYYSGDCATQQDIDDAYAVAIALDADGGGVQAEGDEDIYYCQTVLDSCHASEDDATPQLMARGGGPNECAPYLDCTAHAFAFGAAARWRR